MATFSPSPAPRRSTRPRQHESTPPPPKRRIVVGGSRPSSRFATPVRGLERQVSHASGMDVDQVEDPDIQRTSPEILYAKSKELSVSFYAHLPVEVKQVLKNADFIGDAYSGDIDTLTGFALVASVETCFVWQHAQALKGTPTCYIFSCPEDTNVLGSAPPLHGLVPYGTSREPGLILLSASGNIRFWDSIGIGLAGGDHYTTTSLALAPRETFTNLTRSDPQTYVASTTFGRLFRFTLTSAGGKSHLTAHPFARPTPSSLTFSRFIPSLFSGPSSTTPLVSTEPGNINAIALGQNLPTGGREVCALVDTRVQRWDMKSEGWEEVLSDEEVADIIRNKVREVFRNVPLDDAMMDLELVDLTLDSKGNLIILVSYAGVEDATEDMTMDMNPITRIYAIVRMSQTSEGFQVQNVRGVPYQVNANSGAPMHPRIQLILDGALVSVQFGDAIALCARDSQYEDRITLKTTTDRTFGVVNVDSDSTILVLTATTMMKVTLDMDNVATFDSETGKAGLLKSIMTQAILYLSPENPLSFTFPPDVDMISLTKGAEQLSRAVLESDPEVVHHHHDLTAQLLSRIERLNWLVGFINDNAVLLKMPQVSRQRLATDAEKLYACYQLWIHHNELLATGPTQSVLIDCIEAFMHDVGDADHEDVIRAFFRLRVADIGKLLRKVSELSTRGRELPVLAQANDIALTVLRSGYEHREYNARLYGLEFPMIKPWTSSPTSIDVILTLFDATTSAVTSPASERNKDPNTQLPDLAKLLFACIAERLDYLRSETGGEKDRDELNTRFDSLRPEVLETLRLNGFAEQAFSIAESYQDYSTLAALCHRGIIYPPEDNPNYDRIQHYIEKFKDAFTQELFRWYIQHGEIRVMFAQEDFYSGYMDRYFSEFPNPAISWVHDLGKERYGSTAAALLYEAKNATNLETRHLMLSIGKLSHLAHLNTIDASLKDTVMNDFHDNLDFVSIHEMLLEEFRPAMSSLRGRQTLDTQIDAIVKSNATGQSGRTAFMTIFKVVVRHLLQDRVLSIEDAVDVLTLKDNHETLDDYSTALHLLSHDKKLPEARRTAAFRTVWRRVYIHDDWSHILQTTNITDQMLNDRYKSTALYAAFRKLLQTRTDPELLEKDCAPEEVLTPPTNEEISSRWPGMSEDEVEAMAGDYREESEVLQQQLEQLTDVHKHILELARHDAMWESELSS